MNPKEFIESYLNITGRAMYCSEKARREGLLVLEDELDEKKVNARDIFEYGMRFIIDGTDGQLVEKILSNLVEQEKDETQKLLKTIQKEAVLGIQKGINSRLLFALLNSYTDIVLNEEEIMGIIKA